MEKRDVPSGITPWPWVPRIAVHRLVLRDRHDGHWRHSGVLSGKTLEPFLTDVTAGPMSTTMPAPSWPRMAGNRPSGSAPERVNSSVWQMPVALIRTSTSPALGPCSCTVSIAKGAPALCATAARTSMDYRVRAPEALAVCVAIASIRAGDRQSYGSSLSSLILLRTAPMLAGSAPDSMIDETKAANCAGCQPCSFESSVW